jgi:uncharacterized UPF0160 family protein
MMREFIDIITHDGVMHADEVFAVAFLKLIFRDSKLYIKRTRDVQLINQSKLKHNTIVIDVGMKYNPHLNNFDHHQKEYTGNKSSFGLVAEKFKYEFIKMFHADMETYEHFEKQLIKPIDDWDNNNNNVIHKAEELGIFSIQKAISAYNVYNVYSFGQEESFNEAVKFAINIIRNEFVKSSAYYKEKEILNKYKRAKLVEINGHKAKSKIHFKFYKSWAKDNSIRYLLIPEPNEKRMHEYLIIDTSNTPNLNYNSRMIFLHKSKHLCKFQNWSDAVNYFDNL